MKDIFQAGTNSSGEVFGVIEGDGDVVYFYLHDSKEREEDQIVGAIRIALDYFIQGKDISVIWSKDANYVGALVDGKVVAAFDSKSRRPFGGDIDKADGTVVPPNVVERLILQ